MKHPVTRYLLLLLCAAPLLPQSNTGELRVRVADPTGLPIQSSVDLVSEANQYRRTFETAPDGALIAKRLPLGLYRIEIQHSGFTPFSDLIELRSAIPKEYRVTLGLAQVEATVVVTDDQTLLDPQRTSSVTRIGAGTIQDRETALPGRSLPELVNTQPGW